MIVVDGSALLAILLDQDEGGKCQRALSQDVLLISAASLSAMLIVAYGKEVLDEIQAMLATVRPTIVPLTKERARNATPAYQQWGRGSPRAQLNICDSFAYALAKEYDCPLLYVGNDFAKTDIKSAIARAPK